MFKRDRKTAKNEKTTKTNFFRTFYFQSLNRTQITEILYIEMCGKMQQKIYRVHLKQTICCCFSPHISIDIG